LGSKISKLKFLFIFFKKLASAGGAHGQGKVSTE